MGGFTRPGPQGMAQKVLDKIDVGTLARAATPVPGVVGLVGLVQALGKQMPSWTRRIRDVPRSAKEMSGKLGEIYFRTDEYALDANDEIELKKLCDDLKSLLKAGYRFELKCTGNADHRGKEWYNKELGGHRAESVKRYLTTNILDSRLRVSAESLGEEKASQPGSGKKGVPPLVMSLERRVDIAIEKVVPPVRIGLLGRRGEDRVWALGLENMEIRNRGSVVGLVNGPSETVTVLITVAYDAVTVGTDRDAQINCAVTHIETGKLLFTAGAAIEAKGIITETGGVNPGSGRVARVTLPGHKPPPPNAKRVEVRSRRMPTDDMRDLLPLVYAKLKGKHRNITQHAQSILEEPALVK